jgi:hypothetical protein
MTPIEIFEYKKRWQRNGNYYSVRLHSDLRNDGVEWCKTQLFKQQWDLSIYSNVYEDTYLFEYKQDYVSFIEQFDERFINQ